MPVFEALCQVSLIVEPNGGHMLNSCKNAAYALKCPVHGDRKIGNSFQKAKPLHDH